MKQPFPRLAKRTLALVLALVLLLTVFPVVALAAEESWSGDPDFKVNSGFKNYISELAFRSEDSDLIFEDDQPYDWSVRFKHSYSDGLGSGHITATVTDASGNKIETFTNSGNVNSGTAYTVVSSTDFSKLTTDLYGNFTLTVEVDNGGTFIFSMTKTFSRIDTTPEATEPTEPEEIESTIVATVTSRSNPDNVFTFADPIDLVLNIKKNDGIAAAYNTAITVTKKGSTEVLDSCGVSLPSSTNISLILKDYLKKLPSITTAGIYSVNLTLADSTGAIAHQCSTDFAVVALEGSVTATVTSATSSDFIFNNVVPDLQINLQKNDGIAENLTTVVKVTDGTSTLTKRFTTSSVSDTLTPDLSSLPNPGNYTLTATITDDAGNLRGSVSVSFSRTNVTPMTGWLIDYSPDVTGKIYSDGSDFNLSLSINHAASARKVVTVKAVGTLNGKPFVSKTKKATLSANGGGAVTINGAMLSAYGIFEDVSIEVYDASGNRMWKSAQSYSFARVLDTSTPGDLPLLNINDHFTKNKGEGTLKIPLAAQAGANMWRSTIPWATVEKSEGSYNFSVAKSVMDDTKNNGMQALVILAYGNDDIYGEPNPTNSTWLNAYANYCYETALYMAQNYRDYVVGFEIWNEWNHASMSKVPADYRTGAHYATVVKAASEKIRQVNAKYGTEFKVIAGATAGDGYDNEGVNTFINAMFNATGFFDAVDGVSFHTYSSEETTDWFDQLKGQRVFEYISPAKHDFAARISNYNNLVNKYNKTGKDIEIWLTETGWTTNEVPESSIGPTDGKTHITHGATEEDAAAYLVQLYAWALYDGTLDRIFWYDFMNDISNQTKIWANNQTESNYGLIHNWNNSGDQPLAYSAKAGYVTMCALASKLGGATNGMQIRINSDENIFAYQFEKDGKYITVIWAEGDTKTVNLTLSNSISVSDMYGNATTYSAGNITLTLTGAPIYLEYPSGSVSFG